MKKQAFLIIATLLAASILAMTNSCNGNNSKRYCEDDNFIAYETGSSTTKIAWKMFEGSLSLTQVGLFWIEISTDYPNTKVQIKMTRGDFYSHEAIRIRRAWHLPYTAGAYEDATDGNLNIERQELISVHNPTTEKDLETYGGWFLGDVVPF